MKKIDIDEISNWHDINYERRIENRWFPLDRVKPFLAGLGDQFDVKKIGESFERRDIYSLSFGTGGKKVFMWTQMHGNESTGTKAIIDIIRLFSEPGQLQWLVDLILKECTVTIIPILNPDGAEVYTRLNGQQIDLNRDVIDKKAPESLILQELLHRIEPEFCFNLHDQRTIFSVGPENNTATMSFLAPSIDQDRSITEGRKQTMALIASMNKLLQQLIPNRVGRYTDEFYPTATGDNFQKMGHNTVLIESGHSKGDYNRMVSRKTTFISILEGLRYISSPDEHIDYQQYFEIPENEKNYLDIILKDVRIADVKTDIGVLYVEKLINAEIVFVAEIDKTQQLGNFQADQILNGSDLQFSNKDEANKWIKNKFN